MFVTLSYLFQHIWTNLLTKCTQCQFLSTDVCELQICTHIYSGQKIQQKYIKNQRSRRLRIPKEETEGGHPLPSVQGRGPTPGHARRLPGRRGHPLVPPFGLYLHPIMETLESLLFSRYSPLFCRCRDSKIRTIIRTYPNTLPEAGSISRSFSTTMNASRL